jgi:hypothetical protein
MPGLVETFEVIEAAVELLNEVVTGQNAVKHQMEMVVTLVERLDAINERMSEIRDELGEKFTMETYREYMELVNENAAVHVAATDLCEHLEGCRDAIWKAMPEGDKRTIILKTLLKVFGGMGADPFEGEDGGEAPTVDQLFSIPDQLPEPGDEPEVNPA